MTQLDFLRSLFTLFEASLSLEGSWLHPTSTPQNEVSASPTLSGGGSGGDSDRFETTSRLLDFFPSNLFSLGGLGLLSVSVAYLIRRRHLSRTGANSGDIGTELDSVRASQNPRAVPGTDILPSALPDQPCSEHPSFANLEQSASHTNTRRRSRQR